MKNILLLAFAFCQVIVYGQIDLLKKTQLTPHRGPDYTKTIYRKMITLPTINMLVKRLQAMFLQAAGEKILLTAGLIKKYMVTHLLLHKVNM
ncbi:MAG: hypothetical protein ABI402_21170 [Ferruginibacter sp.]